MPVAIFLMIFGAHMNFLFVIKVNILVLIKWLYTQIMLSIEPRLVNKLWALSLISFKHMPSWCPFLDAHSNIGVQIIVMLD